MPKPEHWLRLSASDLNTAKTAVETNEGMLPTVFYLTQQGTEKALKAYLLFKNIPIQRTHDLVRLVGLCADYDVDFVTILDDAKDINPYSTATRYPDDYYILPSLDTARILIAKAENIYKFVENKIFAIY